MGVRLVGLSVSVAGERVISGEGVGAGESSGG